jgi:50S ribosomal subunit-associated GTPase HflX
VTAIRSVVLVGLFSAKDRDYQARLDELDARVTALGARVLERFVQRRGVSDGGVRLMTAPLSRRFLIGPGKLDEVATACSSRNVDAVLFANELSAYQRRWLSTRLGRPVLTPTDVYQSAESLISPARSHPRARRDPRAGRRRR